MPSPGTSFSGTANGSDEGSLVIQSGHHADSSEEGLAYVAMLLLLVISFMLAFTFLLRVGAEVAATTSRGSSMQVHYLAESAANHAKWRLLNDPTFPDDEQTYYMHSFAGGRYGYKVRRHTDTTFATIATVGVLGDDVVQQSYVLYIPQGSNPFIFLVYDTDVNPADEFPKYRAFDNPSWDPEGTTVNVGDSKVHWLELQGTPLRQEIIMGTLDDSGGINLAVWNGATWGNLLEFTTDGGHNVKRFDIAYESLSGNALVAGRAGWSTPTLSYTVWDGTSWVHDPPLPGPSSGVNTIRYVVMASDPFSDEILIAVMDWDKDITLFQWDGASFTDLGEIEDDTSQNALQVMDIVYEQQSGDAIIIWPQKGDSAPKYRIWNGTTLGPEGSLPDFGKTHSLVRAVADPTSDYIFVAALDSAFDLNVAVWDGDAWIDSREIEIALDDNDRFGFDIAWEASGDEVIVAWVKNGTTDLQYLRWAKGTTLASSTVEVGPDFLAGGSTLQLFPVSGGDKIILALANQNSDLYTSLWSGDSFGAPLLLGSTISAYSQMAFDLAEGGS